MLNDNIDKLAVARKVRARGSVGRKPSVAPAAH